MVKTRVKSSRRASAMPYGYGIRVCKTKYTGKRGLPARCQGVGCVDKWQIQKQKPAYGPAFNQKESRRLLSLRLFFQQVRELAFVRQ